MNALWRLARNTDALPGGPRERELLVRQAGAVDRMTDLDAADVADIADYIHDATEYALRLLAYDRQHASTRGPIPAGDAAWDDDPRGYARQEHLAWMLDS